MYIVSVTVWVLPERIAAFVDATLQNAQLTRQESGNRCFDVSQCTEDPCRFLLYEAYRSQADFQAHQQTAHYLAWKEAVAAWMAQPRQGVRHRSLFPPDEEW